MKRNILNVLGFFAIFLLLLYVCNSIFIPKWIWVDGKTEGKKSRYDSFYNLENNSLQYITLGASKAYYSVNPMQIYAETGIRGYALGASYQDLEVSYYWLKEACKTQKPQYIFLDVRNLFHDNNMPDADVLQQIGSMKFSGNKLKAIFDCSPSDDVKIGLLFPMYQYHDRWDELVANDFKYAFRDSYYVIKGAVLYGTSTLWTDRGERDTDTEIIYHNNGMKLEIKTAEISDENKEMFDKFYQECMKNNIILVPTQFPSIGNWNDGSKELVNAFLKKYDLSVLDLNEEVVNLDWNNDTPDSGEHVNFYGNAKSSAYLGEWLKARITENEAESSSLWENDLVEYRNYEINKLSDDREKALTYLNNISQNLSGKLIVIAVRDEACDAWNDLLQKRMNSLNLYGDFYNNQQNSYIGIVDRGQPVFENWADKTLIYDGTFTDDENTEHSIYIESGGYISSDSAQITIDNKKYAANRRGLNIVVYDYSKDKVTSSVSIDTHESAWKFTTKIKDKTEYQIEKKDEGEENIGEKSEAEIETAVIMGDMPIIEAGTYSFLSFIDENYGFMQDDESGLRISAKQRDLFELEYLDQGLYLIKASGEDKYLTVENWGNTNETGFRFEEYTGLSSQKWFIREHTDHTYSIHSFYNKLCIDIPAGIVAEGNKLQLYDDSGDYPQRFVLKRE